MSPSFRLLSTTLVFTLVLPAAARLPVLPAGPEGGFAPLVEQALPSVVRVLVNGPRGKASEGAGVIISRDGYLLTNRHVVEGASRIRVQFHDDQEAPAELLAADGPADLAVLKVARPGLLPIPFGDSARVRIGDYALAIGNPFGVGTTVTLGIISAKGDGDWLQTDAAINPGNSGGPLLNGAGELIGINTAIVSPSGGSSGIGFALPANLARSIATELIASGRVTRGFLGAGFQPLTEALAEALAVDRGGAIVADVLPDGPAARAGLRKGDVVVSMNGRALRDFHRLQLVAAQAKPGALLRIGVLRQDEELTVPVTLGERPAEAAPAAPIHPEEVLPGAELADQGPHAVVTGVDPEGPGAAAGLRAGDVIVAVNRKNVAGVAAVRDEWAAAGPKAVLLEVNREGSTYFLALAR